MPSGIVPLTEALKHAGTAMHEGLVEVFIQESPLIPRLNWIPFSGDALKHEEEGSLPTPAFRNVNEGYTAQWGSDLEHYWGVAILGGEVKIDVFSQDVVADQKDEMAKQLAKHAKANSLRFDYEALNGTGSVASKGFKGLKTLVDEGFGQKLLNASGGGALTLAKLDEALDLFRHKDGPEEMWLNRSVRRKITDLARTTHSGISLIDTGTDVYGKKVTMYDGVPLVIMGDAMDSSGNVSALLPFTEDPGDAGNDTTSIWMVRHGDDGLSGILGKSGRLNAKVWGELESAPQYQARYEWYPGIAVFNQYTVVRLYGITNA